MEAAQQAVGIFLLENTRRSIVLFAIFTILVLHLASSAYRKRTFELTKGNILGSNYIDIVRAGFSVLLFITGLRILGTVLTVDTCGRLSEDDFVIFGVVGLVTCIVIGAIEMKTALFGKKQIKALNEPPANQA